MLLSIPDDHRGVSPVVNNRPAIHIVRSNERAKIRKEDNSMAEGIGCSVGCTNSVASRPRSHVGLSTDPGHDRAKVQKVDIAQGRFGHRRACRKAGRLSDPILAKALDIHVQLHVCAYPYLQVARPTKRPPSDSLRTVPSIASLLRSPTRVWGRLKPSG
jgi:hypothetical protein